jgi:hypothetical protein
MLKRVLYIPMGFLFLFLCFYVHKSYFGRRYMVCFFPVFVNRSEGKNDTGAIRAVLGVAHMWSLFPPAGAGVAHMWFLFPPVGAGVAHMWSLFPPVGAGVAHM